MCQELDYTWSPTYDGSNNDFLTLQWGESDTYSIETMLQILKFDLFLG